VGVVCEPDIYSVVSAHRDVDGWMQELLVEDIMKSPPLVRAADDAVENVLPVLQSSRAGCVLIEHDGRVIGMVSARDLQAGTEGFRPQGPRPHLSY
jgi:CBS domain-containing protein